MKSLLNVFSALLPQSLFAASPCPDGISDLGPRTTAVSFNCSDDDTSAQLDERISYQFKSSFSNGAFEAQRF